MLNSPRANLSTTIIVDRAIARINAYGLDSLSMRELAADLEVTPMAIYRHVDNKAELLDLIADRVTSQLVPEPADLPWPEQAARICRHARSELIAHPELATLVLQRPVPSSAVALQATGAEVALLIDSGLPPRAIPLVYGVLSIYSMGAVLFEIERRQAFGNRKRRSMDDLPTRLGALVTAFDPDMPNVDEVVSVLSADFGDEQYEQGLRAVIEGLKHLVAEL